MCYTVRLLRRLLLQCDEFVGELSAQRSASLEEISLSFKEELDIPLPPFPFNRLCSLQTLCGSVKHVRQTFWRWWRD
jgi:hypothetical protein